MAKARDNNPGMSALAFALDKLIESGQLDRHVLQISIAARQRLERLKGDRPTTPLEPGQHWIWCGDRWEVKGTGAIVKNPRKTGESFDKD